MVESRKDIVWRLHRYKSSTTIAESDMMRGTQHFRIKVPMLLYRTDKIYHHVLDWTEGNSQGQHKPDIAKNSPGSHSVALNTSRNQQPRNEVMS